MIYLLLLNALLVLVATVIVILALARATAMTASLGEETTLSRFYVGMYAARGLPIGVVTITMILTNLGAPSELRWWLAVAGAIQLVDVVLGARHRLWGMVIGAGVAAIVHLLTALIV